MAILGTLGGPCRARRAGTLAAAPRATGARPRETGGRFAAARLPRNRVRLSDNLSATFRGDRLEWWAFFRDEREALGAAGLPLG
jgi:hypothetical protein